MNCIRTDEEFPFTPPVVRSEGVHVSEIIRDMARELFCAGQRVDSAPDLLQFEKGFLWERVLSEAFGPDMAARPGEIVMDGIACSPDGVGFDDDGEVVVEEYKCTVMSSDKTPEEIWTWRMQVACYCYVVGAKVAVFRVFNLKGNYKDFSPKYNVWRLEFTENELMDVWMSVVGHAKAKGWL